MYVYVNHSIILLWPNMFVRFNDAWHLQVIETKTQKFEPRVNKANGIFLTDIEKKKL